MEPIKLYGESVEFEMPDGRKFKLPMPTAMYDIQELASAGVRAAQKKTEQAQEAADQTGEDKTDETTYTDRDWYADIIEYVRTKAAHNGTPEGIEITESMAAQMSRQLPLIEAEAKKKLQSQLVDMRT